MAIVALRSTFEAMFLTPEARPESEGPVFSLRFPITTVGLAYTSVIILEPSPGGGGGGGGNYWGQHCQ